MLTVARAPDLRAQLAAVITQPHNGSHGYNDVPNSSSASPHEHNIDPAIGGPGGMMSTGGDSGGDDSMGDGRKGGKRELSQSKRAAQNRAAQVSSAIIISWAHFDVHDGHCGFVKKKKERIMMGALCFLIFLSSISRTEGLRN
jgi:hypothetical protein